MKPAGFSDTQRIDAGAFWNDQAARRIEIWTGVPVGRNDPCIGAGQFVSGGAQGGDDRWKASIPVMFGYYIQAEPPPREAVVRAAS